MYIRGIRVPDTRGDFESCKRICQVKRTNVVMSGRDPQRLKITSAVERLHSKGFETISVKLPFDSDRTNGALEGRVSHEEFGF